jgi:hypothetical protein
MDEIPDRAIADGKRNRMATEGWTAHPRPRGGPRGMVYARRRAGQDHQGTKRLSRSPGTNPAADAIDLRGGFTHRAQDSDGISLAR